MVEFEEILTKRLKKLTRLLYHIIVRIFFLRVGQFDFVTKENITIVHQIVHEISFNLPHAMFKVMQEAASYAKLALPNEMFLTLVFKKFGVVLEGEPSKKLQH